MHGKLYLTAIESGTEVGGGVDPPDQLQDLGKLGSSDQITVIIVQNNPGEAGHYEVKVTQQRWEDVWGYAKEGAEIALRDGVPIKDKHDIIVRDNYPVTPETINDLRAAGIKKVTAKVPFYWDIVCEELCGNGHANMQGKLAVVEEGELQGDYKGYYPEKRQSASIAKP